MIARSEPGASAPARSSPAAGSPAQARARRAPLPGWRQRLRRSPALQRTGELLALWLPPTALGWTIAILSGLGLWWYGIERLDLLLFVIGICGLALVGISSALVLGTALMLRRRRSDAATEIGQVEAMSLVRTGFRLPALARLPLVQLRWEWRHPADVEVRTRRADHLLLEEVVALRRAEEPRIVRRIHVESAFGLARASFTCEEARPVAILPWAGRLNRSAALHSFASADGTPHPSGAPEGDRMEIRRYAPGDPARHILWTRYAKTRELVVRVPERSVDRTRRIVAYLVAGPQDEAAAAAARVALESGGLGDSWLFGADGTHDACSDLHSALGAIARSGSLGPVPLCGLGAFLDRVDAPGLMHCIVYASGVEGSWTPQVIETLKRRSGRISFVLGVDGIAQTRPAPLWQRVLLSAPEAAGASQEALSRVSDMLVRGGASVVVADRQTGRYHGELRSPAAHPQGVRR
jgi:uncharacterized protein (DUF58 family)